MTIKVTRDDIQRGKRCDPDCCPIGRALARAGVDHFGVVGSSVMVADGHDHATGLQLPAMVKEWILNYDGNQPVDPLTFELELPRHKAARRPTRKLTLQEAA